MRILQKKKKNRFAINLVLLKQGILKEIYSWYLFYIWKLLLLKRTSFFQMLDYVSNSKYIHINREVMKGDVLYKFNYGN